MCTNAPVIVRVQPPQVTINTAPIITITGFHLKETKISVSVWSSETGNIATVLFPQLISQTEETVVFSLPAIHILSTVNVLLFSRVDATSTSFSVVPIVG